MSHIKTNIMLLLTITLSLFLSSCSVIMASKQNGVEVNVLSACKTRTCLLNHDAKPIQSSKNNSGRLTSETFQAEIPTGSAARAAMHGVLDISTLGLWEVVGTPIEAVKGKKQTYAIKVIYESDSDTIKSMQLVS